MDEKTNSFIIIYSNYLSVYNWLCASVSSTADKEKHGKKDDSSPFKVNVLGKEVQKTLSQHFSQLKPYVCSFVHHITRKASDNEKKHEHYD